MPSPNRLLLSLGTALVASVTYILAQPFINRPQVPTRPTASSPSAPTPTPAFVLYTEDNNLYSFVTPSHWLTTNVTKSASASLAELSACGQTTLSIRQLPAVEPSSKNRLTARKYLQAPSSAKYSKLDGLNALVISDSSPSAGLKPYATAVIEATPSGQLLEFYYTPACAPDLESGKQTEFFPLLKSFRYNYALPSGGKD